MNKLILLFFFISASFFATAQNVVYDENAEVRVVEPFSSIEVSGAVSMYLSQGHTEGLAVSAGEAKYNSKIRTEVKNGVLHIFVEGGVWNGFNWTNRKLRAYVTAININRIDISGASYTSITGSIKSEDLKINISGASEIKGAIDASNLNLDISGASVAKLAGSVKNVLIDASGACKVNSYDLNIANCKISSSGASITKVTVTGEINADASGGSMVYYKGTGIGKLLNATSGSFIKNRSGNED